MALDDLVGGSTDTENEGGSGESGGLGGSDYTDVLQEISDKLYKEPESESDSDDIPSSDEIKSKIGTEITIFNKMTLGKYDLDEDGKITENDYNIAFEKENPPSVISVLKQIPDNIKAALDKNQFTNKDQYIKYVAAMIFAYSDFDRHNVNTLVTRAIQNAKVLANNFKF